MDILKSIMFLVGLVLFIVAFFLINTVAGLITTSIILVFISLYVDFDLPERKKGVKR